VFVVCIDATKHYSQYYYIAIFSKVSFYIKCPMVSAQALTGVGILFNTEGAMDILVVGGGGREHAIVQLLSRSTEVGKIYCAPGNAGIAELAECVDIAAGNISSLVRFVQQTPGIGLTVVAPDDPLALGLVNELTARGYRAFGPTGEAALIESSKVFSKGLMEKYGIPTAKYRSFTDSRQALAYVRTQEFPLVIKADGLALGKGVIICQDLEQAERAVQEIMEDRRFGSAGSSIVVEEFIHGREVSVLAFTDGESIAVMPSSQDYKRVGDGDTGPNTGGMGTFSPSPLYTDELHNQCMESIYLPTVRAMRAEGRTFKGVLYFGLILDEKSGVKVLEYNARFGDPETQVVLPLLKTDLLSIFNACIDGTLDKLEISWEQASCVCVVMASKGYPGKYRKDDTIEIQKEDGIMYYHAGTDHNKQGALVTSGGRVLGVCAKADTVENARERAYNAVKGVKFHGAHYRTDIALPR